MNNFLKSKRAMSLTVFLSTLIVVTTNLFFSTKLDKLRIEIFKDNYDAWHQTGNIIGQIIRGLDMTNIQYVIFPGDPNYVISNIITLIIFVTTFFAISGTVFLLYRKHYSFKKILWLSLLFFIVSLMVLYILVPFLFLAIMFTIHPMT